MELHIPNFARREGRTIIVPPNELMTFDNYTDITNEEIYEDLMNNHEEFNQYVTKKDRLYSTICAFNYKKYYEELRRRNVDTSNVSRPDELYCQIFRLDKSNNIINVAQ